MGDTIDDVPDANGSEGAVQTGRRQLLAASEVFSLQSQDGADSAARRPNDTLGHEPEASLRRFESRVKDEVHTSDAHDGVAQPQSTKQTRTLYTDVALMIDTELSKVVSPEVEKHIRKQTLRLTDKIESLQSVSSRIKKLKEELLTLEARRLPKGLALKIGFETELLDSAKVPDAMVGGSIHDNMSIRDAKTASFIDYQITQHKLDLVACEAQRAELRVYTQLVKISERCLQRQTAVKKNAGTLDLDNSDMEDESDPVVARLTAKAQTIYKKVVDKTANALAEKERRAEESVKQQLKVTNKLLKRTPIQWSEKTIEDIIDAKLKGKKGKAKGKGQTAAASGDAPQYYETVDGFKIHTQGILHAANISADTIGQHIPPSSSKSSGKGSKNALSPIKGGGTISQNKGKGKTKSKDKSSAKGLGKGSDGSQRFKGQFKGQSDSSTANQDKGGMKGFKGRGRSGGRRGRGKGRGGGRWRTTSTN